jgi:hypothetical protein
MKKLVTLSILFATLTSIVQAGQFDQIINNCLIETNNVPDAGTTSALMGIALAGLAVVRRFVR